MLKKVLLGCAALLIVAIAGLFAVASMQPSEFRIVRSTSVAAPQAAVFAQVNDFHKWQDWSPWAKLDPNAAATFSGPEAGEGASFAWEGNAEVGSGSMTITESVPYESIAIRLDFKEPMEATNRTDFTFQLDGEQTVVTWAMSGQNDIIGKVFCLFMDMDAMMGGDFEKGLASMKAIVESAQVEPAANQAEG